MYLYIFGSACRGELDKNSDIDMLAIHTFDENIDHLDGNKLSIYSEKKIKKIWSEGNPFAWHLYFESKLVHSSDETDYIKSLNTPSLYTNGLSDCKKFFKFLNESIDFFQEDKFSLIFDLSTIFLCIRNIATCYSLYLKQPNFSRNSALKLGSKSLNIKEEAYQILENCRLANTRGKTIILSDKEIKIIMNELECIKSWAEHLIEHIEI